MSEVIEVLVPDIGDYKGIPVIEVLVSVGDMVEVEQSLVTLESDKARIDVPSSAVGVVREIKVKVGDSDSEGSLIVTLSNEANAEPSAPSSVATLALVEEKALTRESSGAEKQVPGVSQNQGPTHEIKVPEAR